MNFNDYNYIYKDSHGTWNECTNPKFVAEHKYCRAIPKAEVSNINKYLSKVNSGKINL